MRSARFISLLFTVLALAATAAADPVDVDAGDAPDQGICDLEFTTRWKVPAEGDGYLVGQVTDALLDGDGTLYLLDGRLKDIKVFSDEGAWLRTLGGEGDGPGECRDARGLVRATDGRIGIVQGMPGAIVWLDPDGTPAGTAALAGPRLGDVSMVTLNLAVQTGDLIAGWVALIHLNEDNTFTHEDRVVTIAPDGTVGDVLYTPPPSDMVEGGSSDVWHEGAVYKEWLRRWTPDGRGGLWIAPERDAYVLQHWTGPDQLDLVVSRTYPPVVRSAARRAELLALHTRNGRPESSVEIGETAPVFHALRLGVDGNVWCQLTGDGARDAGEPLAVYDVLSPAGHWLEQVRLLTALDATDWILADDHTLIALVGDPEGEAATLYMQAAAP